jgi:cystathionine beta-lyase
MIPHPVLRHKVWRGLNTDEVAEPNAFAMAASIAAFTEGEDWLNELRAYIKQNKKIATEYIDREIPQIKVVSSEATYLLWLDCSAFTQDASLFQGFLRKETGLYVTEGVEYGENGKAFLRMNVGTQRSRVLDGLDRLKRGVEAYRAISCVCS